MAKTKDSRKKATSVSLDSDTEQKLKELADFCCEGNKSRLIRDLIRFEHREKFGREDSL